MAIIPDSSILRISEAKTLELVELYKKEECLWNTSSPDYKVQAKRRLAAEKIAKILNVPYFEWRHVITKFKNLRNSYCQELKKAVILQNIASDEETVPSRKIKPRPQWYAVMDSFIRPHLQANYCRSGPTLVINGGIIKREPEREPMEDPDELWDNPASEDLPSDIPKPAEGFFGESGNDDLENTKRPASSIDSNSPTPKRIKSEDLLDASLRDVTTQLAVLKDDIAVTRATTLQRGEDVHDNFGKYVASLLRLMPMRKSLLLQTKIANMITADLMEEQNEHFIVPT